MASRKGFEYVLSDLSFLVSRKTGPNHSLSGGYLLRIRENKLIHRTIQQFGVVSSYPSFRLGHRFAADQSFAAGGPPVFRFRYRITPELPLNGQTVDPGEFYFKFSNEYLLLLEDRTSELEVRIVPMLGFEFNDVNKLEAGVDYRLGSLMNTGTEHTYWLSINWYIKI